MLNNKQIIYISSYDEIRNPFYGGGGSVSIHNTAKFLSKYYSVVVITGKYPGSMDGKFDGVYYKHIGNNINIPQFSQLAYSFMLPSVVRKEKYDLWIESFTPPFSTNFLQIFTRKPVIGLAHMICSEDMTRKYKLPIFKFIETFGLKSYRDLIFTSKEIAHKIMAINPKANYHVIPNGIRIPKNIIPSPKHGHILYLGRLESNQKGIDLLIGSYSLINNQINEKLILAGEGSVYEKEKIKNLIKALKLNNKVMLVGKVNGRSKTKLINESKLMVIPSRFETFSISALEGLAYGRPVLCFNIEGLKWIPNKLVKKVCKFDTTKYAKCMYEMVSNHKKANQNVKAGRKFSQNFSIDKINHQYLQVIRYVINGNGKNN